jgi:hypothetical protein
MKIKLQINGDFLKDEMGETDYDSELVNPKYEVKMNIKREELDKLDIILCNLLDSEALENYAFKRIGKKQLTQVICPFCKQPKFSQGAICECEIHNTDKDGQII